MRLKNEKMKDHKPGLLGRGGQSVLEYVAVAGVVSAALVIMSTYVFRSVQATQQMIQNEFRNQ